MNDAFDRRDRVSPPAPTPLVSGSALTLRLAALALASFGDLTAAPPAGGLPTGSIGGSAVEDVTGNGVTSDDRPIQGRVIRLFRDNGDATFNADSDLLVTTATTRQDGTYVFRSLPVGTYFVQQQLPGGWSQTEPAAPEHDPIVTPAECGPTPAERNDTLATAIATGLQPGVAGSYRARGKVGDNNYQALDVDLFAVPVTAGSLLRVDLDALAFNSSLDPILRIFDSAGRPVAADDDAIGGGADSHLDFYAPASGAYYVGVSGWINVFYDPLIAGSGAFAQYTGEYTIDIEVDPEPRPSPLAVTLTQGEQRTGAHLAGSRFGSITGKMFIDVNGDGRQDPGEPGLNGQAVALWYQGTIFGLTPTRSEDRDGNGLLDPVTESGCYSFDGLMPDVYEVNNLFFFGLGPAGWTQVFPSLEASDLPCVGEVSSGPPTDPGVTGLIPDLTVDLEHGLCDWFITGNLLHFGQATPNIGLGPMELQGGEDLGNGTQVVYQRIYQNTALSSYIDLPAGTFTFHPEHGHIHFDDYARYSLRQALPDADGDDFPEVGDVVAGGQKTSFCLVDVAPYDLTLPNAATEASGFGCGTVQRISVGWEDIYEPYTPGQQIDVGRLAAGQYWLEAEVDPDNHLREANENNNVGRTLITIGPGAPNARPGSFGVQVVSSQTAGDRTFAIFQLITINGLVFDDLNANGRQDNKEHGLDGWIVFLDLNGDGELNNPEGDGLATALAAEPWSLTDNQGRYEFPDLGPGTYPVRVVPQASWTQTTANPTPISARSGESISGLDFGLVGVN